MYKRTIIEKVFTTTLLLFIILSITSIPITINNKVLRTNLEIKKTSNLDTTYIYLINKDNLLVKTIIKQF